MAIIAYPNPEYPGGLTKNTPNLFLIDRETGEKLRLKPMVMANGSRHIPLAFLPDNETVVAAAEKLHIYKNLGNENKSQETQLETGFREGLNSLTISPDGSAIAVTTDSNPHLQVWNPETHKKTYQYPPAGTKDRLKVEDPYGGMLPPRTPNDPYSRPAFASVSSAHFTAPRFSSNGNALSWIYPSAGKLYTLPWPHSSDGLSEIPLMMNLPIPAECVDMLNSKDLIYTNPDYVAKIRVNAFDRELFPEGELDVIWNNLSDMRLDGQVAEDALIAKGNLAVNFLNKKLE